MKLFDLVDVVCTVHLARRANTTTTTTIAAARKHFSSAYGSSPHPNCVKQSPAALVFVLLALAALFFLVLPIYE